MKSHSTRENHYSVFFLLICAGLLCLALYPAAAQAENGVCGSAHGDYYISDPYPTPPTGETLCSVGTAADRDDTTTSWKWYCNKTGGSGKNAFCAASKVSCGSMQGGTSTNQPTSGLCAPTSSLAQNMQDSGNTWTWDCVDSANTSVGCWAYDRDNGVCGSAAASPDDYVNPPSTNLCSSGNPTSPFNDGDDHWEWQCTGVNGGSTHTCEADIVNCGWRNGGSYSNTFSNGLCDEGTPSAVTDSGDTWTWTCTDVIGVAVSCSATHRKDGACGPAINNDYVNPPPSTDLCSSGNPTSPFNDGYDHWKWQCTGVNGGSTYTCGVDIVNCGSANGRTYSSAPTSYLCSEGTPSAVTDSGDTWTWTCTDFLSDSVSCLAYDRDNGSCGASDGQTFEEAPTENLCSVGTPSAVVDSGSTWTWSCAGTNGGSTDYCSAIDSDDGVCGSAQGQTYEYAPTENLCSTGTPSAVTPVGTLWQWTCSGVNGGDSVDCTANYIFDGECGYASGGSYEEAPTVGLCDLGTPSSVVGVGNTWTWTCVGNGGMNANCSATHLTAEDVSINQYCAAPPFIVAPVEPNVLSVIDASGSMGWCAYNPELNKKNCCDCDTSGGCGWTYNQNEEGYFRPDKNYRYNSAGGYWEETVNASTTCPNRRCMINTSNVYKGSCLNFNYMRRVDLVRWAMTGGKPLSCSDSHTFDPGHCDPELWAEPGNATKVGAACNDTIGGCIMETQGGTKVKVPWTRVWDGLAYQFKNMSIKPRMGAMFYSSGSVRSAGQVYMGDFTAPNSTDEDYPYMNLITAINSSEPDGGTPTGPAMWDAFNYFKQVNPQYGGIPPQQGEGDRWKNPMYVCDGGGANCILVECAKNFVLLMSDGQWNNPSCSIDNNASDPVKPAYQMHQTFTNTKANKTTDVNAVHTIGLFLGGTGAQSLKNVAMYGSFTKTNTWPDSLSGYPAVECDMDDCDSYGKGSACTALPASSSDWDTNGDGKPDTFHAATNATEIKDAIKNAILDMLRRSSSGTAVSVLSSSEGSGANLMQALFYPKRSFGNSEISWISDVMNYWYYMDPFFESSQIREDTVRDGTDATLLKLTNDYIVSFAFDSSQNKTMAHRWQDTDGDGDADVDKGKVPIEDAAAIWRAGIQLWKTSPAAGYRPTPKTTIDGSTLIDFKVDNVATLDDYLGVADTVTAKNVINYVKGYDCADASGTPSEPTGSCSTPDSSCCPSGYTAIGRNRTVTMDSETHVWKLGDVINSTPRIMGPAQLNNYNATSPIGYDDQTYYDFITTTGYKNRQRVFVGANDGMFHAFRLGKLEQGGAETATLTGSETDIGRETWAFIPKNVLPFLKYLSVQDYCHIYMVDGPISLNDVSINGGYDAPKTSNSWRTMLIGSMGIGGATIKKTCNGARGGTICDADSDCAGGVECKNPDSSYRIGAPLLDGTNAVGLSSYFAFDMTDQDNPVFKWEFSHQDLGVSNVGPAIVRTGGNTKNGKWYAVIASGPTGPITTQEFHGQSNQNLKLFVLDLATGTLVREIDTGITNAFAGSIGASVADLERNDINAAGNYQDDVLYIGYVQNDTSGGVLRLVIDDDTDPANWTVSNVISGIGPVTTSVVNLLDRQNGKLWLFFAEGRYFYKADDLTNQRKLFGIQEPCFTGSPLNIAKTCASSLDLSSDLQNQDTPSGTLSTGKKGWYINMNDDVSTTAAERVISNPTTNVGGAVYFLSFAPTSDICSFGGTTYLWAVDYATGGSVDYEQQGRALVQVSTGEIQEIDLNTAFTERDNRKTGGIYGLPPVAAPPAILTNPLATRRFMHIQER